MRVWRVHLGFCLWASSSRTPTPNPSDPCSGHQLPLPPSISPLPDPSSGAPSGRGPWALLCGAPGSRLQHSGCNWVALASPPPAVRAPHPIRRGPEGAAAPSPDTPRRARATVTSTPSPSHTPARPRFGPRIPRAPSRVGPARSPGSHPSEKELMAGEEAGPGGHRRQAGGAGRVGPVGDVPACLPRSRTRGPESSGRSGLVCSLGLGEPRVSGPNASSAPGPPNLLHRVPGAPSPGLAPPVTRFQTLQPPPRVQRSHPLFPGPAPEFHVSRPRAPNFVSPGPAPNSIAPGPEPPISPNFPRPRALVPYLQAPRPNFTSPDPASRILHLQAPRPTPHVRRSSFLVPRPRAPNPAFPDPAPRFCVSRPRPRSTPPSPAPQFHVPRPRASRIAHLQTPRSPPRLSRPRAPNPASPGLVSPPSRISRPRVPGPPRSSVLLARAPLTSLRLAAAGAHGDPLGAQGARPAEPPLGPRVALAGAGARAPRSPRIPGAPGRGPNQRAALRAGDVTGPGCGSRRGAPGPRPRPARAPRRRARDPLVREALRRARPERPGEGSRGSCPAPRGGGWGWNKGPPRPGPWAPAFVRGVPGRLSGSPGRRPRARNPLGSSAPEGRAWAGGVDAGSPVPTVWTRATGARAKPGDAGPKRDAAPSAWWCPTRVSSQGREVGAPGVRGTAFGARLSPGSARRLLLGDAVGCRRDPNPGSRFRASAFPAVVPRSGPPDALSAGVPDPGAPRRRIRTEGQATRPKAAERVRRVPSGRVRGVRTPELDPAPPSRPAFAPLRVARCSRSS
ncbi:basic proline-rich protein-like [Suncus etruscus]|uniref:basic proline-rich protein-like n=1 Tax=Suncus etruscus TaxID=109475 RepID=UPI00210FCCFC|nr:basic proline-rich protein-like [Suncus etruscus]